MSDDQTKAAPAVASSFLFCLLWPVFFFLSASHGQRFLGMKPFQRQAAAIERTAQSQEDHDVFQASSSG